MKHVFPTKEVIRIFANLSKDEMFTRYAGNARNNVYIKNGRLCSYGPHFVMAKYVTNNEGNTMLLVSTRSSTNTTNKHMNWVRILTRQSNCVYVPDADSLQASLCLWVDQAESLLRSLIKARKPEIYLNQLSQINTDLAAYVKEFGVPRYSEYETLKQLVTRKEK